MSPDSHKANKGSKEEQGRNSEENSRSKLSTPGNQTSPQVGLVKSTQPSFMASSDEANTRTKNDGVLIHQITIYVDEEIVNAAEAKTTV
jgi:hypothetical protein